MELVKHGDGLVRQPPGSNAPTVTVIFGGVEGRPLTNPSDSVRS